MRRTEHLGYLFVLAELDVEREEKRLADASRRRDVCSAALEKR